LADPLAQLLDERRFVPQEVLGLLRARQLGLPARNLGNQGWDEGKKKDPQGE